MIAPIGGLSSPPALLLLVAVVAVGILHTAVPDHWLPLALLARQHGWSRAETASAAARAGLGHVLSTLAIGIAVWVVGISAAQRLGGIIDSVTSIALILFGGWCVVASFREWRADHAGDGHGPGQAHPHGHGHRHGHRHGHGHDHPHDHDDALRHSHWHRHADRAPHSHRHDHALATAHPVTRAMALDPPFHEHSHRATGRGALLIILGSSPMVEGIPAFFAAIRFGVGLLVAMAVLFAASTIATYVALCVYSAAGLRRSSLGPLERYGEMLSGGIIALVGVVFWVWPMV